jgi:hypothetical protein
MIENKTYNPMSKEFQEESKKLGLTGRQLIVKYQIDGKPVEKNVRKLHGRYTDKQLLWYLIQFYEKYGRPPTQEDFNGNSRYPSFMTYVNRFGSWSAALKLVELDVESMIKKGVLETTQQIGRFGEMIIRDYFKIHPIDLAGENCQSPWDGICPNGKIYDVKSSKLYIGGYYNYDTGNKYKDNIEIYYFLAFNNKDHKKLDYVWRIPGEVVEKEFFRVGSTYCAEFNVYNIEEYNITEKLKDVLMKYGLTN